MTSTQTNWAGNLTYSNGRWHYPQTVADVQAIVKSCDKVRVVGSRHSFNAIADSPENFIALEQLERVMVIDPNAQTVTIDGGVRYGELCQFLHGEGYALHNLASLPHISVAGACATATHGSGDGNGNLATAVVGLEIVTADGELLTLSREQNPEQFNGVVVGLGAVGVVTKLTLAIQPTFAVRQFVYENLPLAQIETHFDEIFGSAYSVSLFTTWADETINQLWLKQRVNDDTAVEMPAVLYGGTAAPTHRHPITAVSPESCTAQMGLAGPWHERLPHFRMAFTPSNGEELQSEYFVPRQQAVAAIKAVMQLNEQITPLLFISEIRSIAADDLWLSACYQQDCVGLHFTWQPRWPAVREVLPLIEEALAPFGARPHWGKLFTVPAVDVRKLYPKMADFQQLLQQVDPQGKFRNAFVETYIW